MTLRLSRPAEVDVYVKAWQTDLGPGSIFLTDAGRAGRSPTGGSLLFTAGEVEAVFDVQPECSVLEGERYGFEILSVSARPAYGQEIPAGFSVEPDPDGRGKSSP